MKLLLSSAIFALLLTVACSGTSGKENPGPTPPPPPPTGIEWSQAALDAANIQPGDEVVIRDGVYTNVYVKLNIAATEARPVVIRAATPGGVVIKGNSTLWVGGSWVTVSGFHFKDCDVVEKEAVFNFRHSTRTHATDCRLTNCVFSGSGQDENKTKDIKWVSVYGVRNRVDHCSFIDKKIIGSLLVVWVETTREGCHTIANNFFTHPLSLKDNGSAINGQEMIRIGTSEVSMSTASCTVEGNYFYRCDGEAECISNKSCGNTYRGNLFDETQGCLTLRHGNDCIVDGNYFFGRGVANTGGVRIIGERHKVYNNYFEALMGTDHRSAITLVRGIENSPLSGYFQVKDATVALNTIVNCKQGFAANINTKTNETMPVIGTRITSNLIVSTGTGTDKGIVQVDTYSPQIAWDNNYVYKTTVTGITSGTVSASAFDLALDGGLYILPAAKAGGYTKLNDLSYISVDLRGAARPAAKTPGATEPTGAAPRQIPTRESTGAGWTPNL